MEQRRPITLQWILVFPFLLQIFLAVGIVGYLSFRNGQKAVNTLISELLREVNARIEKQVDSQLAIVRSVKEMDVRAIQSGNLDVQEINASSAYTTGKFFWNQIQTFGLAYISFSNTNQEFIGSGYFNDAPEIAWLTQANPIDFYAIVPDEIGNPQSPVKLQAEGGRNFFTEWYYDPIAAKKTIWGKVYSWPTEPTKIGIYLGTPVYSQTGQLLGVLSIDISLAQINDFLQSLKIGKTGKTFIMERSGKLVSASSAQPSYTIIQGQAEQLKAMDSPDPLIQSAAMYLMGQNTLAIQQTQQFSYYSPQRQKNFLIVTPYVDQYGLDWLIVSVLPETDFMAQIHQSTKNTIALCAGALAIAIGVGLMTVRWITQPILRLIAASQAIANGKLDQNVEIGMVNEVGLLAQSFNQMAAQLKQSFAALEKSNEELEHRVERRTAALQAEQAKSEELLLNILPEQIATRLKQNPGIIADDFQEVTVLFADIVAFTALSAHLGSAKTVEFLNAIFSVFDQLSEKHGLEKIKTIGDAYMVVGGLPNPKPNHREAIVDMALEMQQEIKHFKVVDQQTVSLRIGIHTGAAVAGVIGTKKFIYDLWGDTVNLASRMESHGEPDRIQVSEAVYQFLKQEYTFEKRGTIAVKGQGEMTTYWLMGKP
jgi:class 3 adenylate cyclase/HAMP domain-containing protein